MDRYPDFESLSRSERQGCDYRILCRLGTSGVAVFCIHGGEIEPGTTRLADAIAGAEHSFYAFEGIKHARNRELHITSTRFDEPLAMEIVRQSEIIVSIHGCADEEPGVQLGGLNAELKREILLELQRAGFPAAVSADPALSAVDQRNICNLCGRGMGVQIEVSRGLRAGMFRDLTPQGRRFRTALFASFTAAVRRGIEPFAVLCAANRPLQNTD